MSDMRSPLVLDEGEGRARAMQAAPAAAEQAGDQVEQRPHAWLRGKRFNVMTTQRCDVTPGKTPVAASSW